MNNSKTTGIVNSTMHAPANPNRAGNPKMQEQVRNYDKLELIGNLVDRIKTREERRKRRLATMEASTYSLQERMQSVSDRVKTVLSAAVETNMNDMQRKSNQELSTALKQMAAFSEGRATTLPAIADDSGSDDETSSSNTTCPIRQELIQPLLDIVEEMSGHVANIEEGLRVDRSNASNQTVKNGNNNAGGGWAFAGKNKNQQYVPHNCPGNLISHVNNTNIFSTTTVLNNGSTLSKLRVEDDIENRICSAIPSKKISNPGFSITYE